VKKPTPDPLRTKEGTVLPPPPYITGGPPFPEHPTDDGRYGISILDHFAAHIMAGLCARPDMTIDQLKLDGAQNAYWLAALMVDLRGKLPIEPTPVPVTPPEESVPPPVMPPEDLP
jgi:hypothetical protein